MPNLVQSLKGRDIGFLRIVARLWGIELIASDLEKVKDELSKAILNPGTVNEMVESLPIDARSALEALVNGKGKLPWAAFTRQFGEVRDAGPGKRDRERIFLNPVSPAEILFYRAFLAKAFFDMPAGAQEFAYIPNDFLPYFVNVYSFHDNKGHTLDENIDREANPYAGSASSGAELPMGRPATPKEHSRVVMTSDRLLDDATTLLAAMRMGLPVSNTQIPIQVVLDFLISANIIKPSIDNRKAASKIPLITEVRRFLETSRRNALEMLLTPWLESGSFNELRQVPGFACEGEWINQPVRTRKYLLSLLKTIPQNQWWSLSSFVISIKEKNPDFQRPAGDYDSWFIRRKSDDTYLRGFSNWNEVDGALIRYMISGPMFWLGLVDLAFPSDRNEVSAFRKINTSDRRQVPETAKLQVSSQGRIIAPRLVPRYARYQIARFCDWDLEKEKEYRYRISPASLMKAANQGLKVGQLLGLLARHSVTEIPPSLIKALKRWELNGTEAKLETQTILKVSRPEVLEELRKSKAGRFLVETLGPVTATVKPGSQQKVLIALAEMGLLGEEL